MRLLRACSVGLIAFQTSQILANSSRPGASAPASPASRSNPKICAPLPMCDSTCAVDQSLQYEGPEI